MQDARDTETGGGFFWGAGSVMRGQRLGACDFLGAFSRFISAVKVMAI